MKAKKVEFEECPIKVLDKADINRTLAVPSRISRLQRMKDFFAKSKAQGGKLAMPKHLLFTDDFVGSNFGATPIYEYNDNIEVVGSRRDFKCFSYYINNSTGELQKDYEMTTRDMSEDDFLIRNNENISDNLSVPSTPIDRFQSPVDWTSRPDTPPMFCEPSGEIDTAKDKDFSPLSINIDEGIEIDEFERASMLLPAQPTVKLIDLRLRSPGLFPSEMKVNDSINIDFNNSVLTMQDELAKNVSDFTRDFTLPDMETEEINFKNLFLIPLKRLKHKCIFDLPNSEYGELKKMKREQFKATGIDAPLRNTRIFNPFDLIKSQLQGSSDDDEPLFLGFTKAQQQMPITAISPSLYPKPMREIPRSKSPLLEERKYSNDSGMETDCSFEDSHIVDDTALINITLSENSTMNKINASLVIETLETTVNDINSSLDINSDTYPNISGVDSCYQSLASGESSKVELSSFFKDLETRNNTIDESLEDDLPHEPHEQVLLMQKSAINVSSL